MEAKLLLAAVEGRTPVVHQLLRDHGSLKSGGTTTTRSTTTADRGSRNEKRGAHGATHGANWVEFDVAARSVAASKTSTTAADDRRLTVSASKTSTTAADDRRLTVSALGRVLLGVCKSQSHSGGGRGGGPRVDIVVALCRHAPGVLPAAVTRRGTTALMGAALRGHAAVCMALVEEGADVDATNDQEQTALSFAATRGHHKVVFALLDRPKRATTARHKRSTNDLPDTNGRTPLIHAATGGHLQCCELLLSMARARTNTVDAHGRTPLILAAAQGHKALCRLLVEDHGADVNRASTHGITPLMAAIDASHSDCAFLLLDRLQADIRRRNSQGACALTYACKRGLVGICVSLVQMGLEVDSANDRGTTALMVAANNGHVDICRFLLDQGADLDAVNADYATPIDCASSPQVNTLFVKWLREHEHGRIASARGRAGDGGQAGNERRESGSSSVARRIIGTREEEEGKQQRQRERERLWVRTGERGIVNEAVDEGKTASPINPCAAEATSSRAYEEHAIVAESKRRTEQEQEQGQEPESEPEPEPEAHNAPSGATRTHDAAEHRKRTLRAINEQHAMITHSFLGQKVDEDEIERVNALLAERMARFYDMCERDDGSGQVFLSEDPAEHEDDWQSLLRNMDGRNMDGGAHENNGNDGNNFNDGNDGNDEPSAPPPAPPPRTHEPYIANEDRAITNLHYRTITLEEEREDRRRNATRRNTNAKEDNRLRMQARQQLRSPVPPNEGGDSEDSEEEDEIHAFNCPITQDRMTAPVTCMDGHTYERKGIERWLEDHDTSPLTGVKLPSKMLIPNHSLRHAIEEYDNANARNRGKK